LIESSDALKEVINEGINGNISSKMFDAVDIIVFEYLCDTCFSEFQSSKHWTRYHNFMILTTKPFVEKDFDLFRVLGRGGFGLVSGCKSVYSGKVFALKAMDKIRYILYFIS
jgi:hypothetical protein